MVPVCQSEMCVKSRTGQRLYRAWQGHTPPLPCHRRIKGLITRSAKGSSREVVMM